MWKQWLYVDKETIFHWYKYNSSWSWWILCKSPDEGATRKGGRQHAYGLGAASRLLNTERGSVSAKAAGRLFQSGIVRNTEQCQSGDDLSLALGPWRFSWLFESRAGLVARWMFIESGGTASRLWRILQRKIMRWYRRRSGGGEGTSSYHLTTGHLGT